MPFNLQAYLGIQPDALKVYAQRAEVLAANLANADTPGYQAKDIDFRAALAAADPATSSGAAGAGSSATGTLRMTTTSADDLSAQDGSDGVSTAQFLKYRIPLAPSLDGNTVSSQMEEAKFAQNTVRFEGALTILEDRFQDLTTAITGGQ